MKSLAFICRSKNHGITLLGVIYNVCILIILKNIDYMAFNTNYMNIKTRDIALER